MKTLNVRNVTLLSVLAALCSLHLTANAAGPSKATSKSPVFQNTKVIDLSHSLGAGMPDFHGDANAFKYSMLFTIAKDGFADGKFSTPEHYGTHMDAPSHFARGGDSIDRVAAAKLVAPFVVLDVRDEVRKNPDYCVTLDKVKNFETAGAIPQHAVVLLLTGWSSRWTVPTQYRNADSKGTMHFPGFTLEAARYLGGERNARGLGIDTLSLDPGNSTTYGVHHHTLGKGMYLIENLNNLEQLPQRGGTLISAPLRIKDGTGSPARVLALVP